MNTGFGIAKQSQRAGRGRKTRRAKKKEPGGGFGEKKKKTAKPNSTQHNSKFSHSTSPRSSLSLSLAALFYYFACLRISFSIKNRTENAPKRLRIMPPPAMSTGMNVGGTAGSMPEQQMRRSLLAASARTASAHRRPRSRVQERGPTPPAGRK